MNIEETLKSYLEKKSRIMVLEIRIKKANEELFFANQPFKENERDAIEGMQMSATTIKPDKSSPTNRVTSATENTAAHYREEKFYKNEFEIMTIKKDIKKWESEKIQLEKDIVEIDAALDSLTKEEQFIIQMFYFEKMIWRKIESTYELSFKFFKDEDTLKRIRKDALEKIKRIVA